MNFRRSRTRSRRNSMSVMASTEKWKTYNKRVSRRGQTIDEESDGDLPQVQAALNDWVEEFFVRKSTGTEQIDQDVEVNLSRKQTLILSTLVPDEILLMKNFDTADPKRFVGVLMMADVSGYTALSERYNNTGKGGTYRLTVTLNTYLGSLIEVIYSHGGDIIKFAGDAFLALWKTDKRTFLCHTIHTAIICALIIQHSYGSYETDVKVNLKVKLAISAGNLIFAPIGSGIDMNYVIIGLPVVEAKIAESLCNSGEVKLTPTAWGHCYSRNYDHVIGSDGHVTIRSILYDPRENDVSKPFLGFSAMVRQVNKQFTALENMPEVLLDDNIRLSSADISKRNEQLNLRKTILLAEEKKIGSEIRKFMIRPVLTQIDAHQPLEYLTEMRYVTVLFVTLKPRECPYPQLITIVNNSYQITCEIVYKSMGCVNKIILFDKDVMILVIFGLRGFKHESEAQAALKCAFSIKKSVSALDGVLEVSIGVTTGQVYCGVVGHPLRREFTVIGAIVNKAARFMCSFHNKITCDEATFIKSKMSSNGFTLQPPTKLKGIHDPGKIYEYTEEIRVKEMFNIPLIPPLLNREDEMEYFLNWLNDHNLSFRDFDALLIIGENRMGKSRFLEWIARYGKNKGLNVCFLSLTSIHSATPFLALSQIIDQILGLKEPIKGFEKEEKIVQQLQHYSEDLCYLNSILKVRFVYHEGVYSQNENIRKEKTKSIFKKLIMSLSEISLIVLDDLQNLDSPSWEYVNIMIDCLKIFTVLSVTRRKFSTVHHWLYSVFIKNNIRKISLGPLSSTWTAALACQILDVDAVSNDLCNALRTKCNGMPGLIESFIVHLFSSGALEIKKIHENELENWHDEDLQFPDPTFLRPVALNLKDQENLEKLIADNSSDEVSICYVNLKEELNTNINVQNLDALIMIQIDSLTPYQQLLLKIASVIGNVLSRDLLENIMYENNMLTTAKAIKRLFSMRILSCANVKHIRRNLSTATIISNYSVDMNMNLTCECSFEYDPESELPKYAYCKVMKFRNKNSRKTFYELLPLNQKKEFHSRIVTYLENYKQKCPACGGSIMVVQSSMNFYGQNNGTFLDNQSVIEDCNENQTDKEECEIFNVKTSQSQSSVKNQSFLDIKKAKSDSLKSTCSRVTYRSNFNYFQSNTSIFKRTQCNPIREQNLSYQDDTDLQTKSTKNVAISNINISEAVFTCDNKSVLNMFREVAEANKISDWHKLGVKDSQDDYKTDKNEKQKGSFFIKIEKGASQTNFTRCTCTDLNIIIYEQLIQHAKEAELNTKMVEFLIQFSYLNILANNTDNALPKLEEAENICHAKPAININEFDRIRFLGKIFSMKAAAFLMSGKLTAAKFNIELAANIYRINLNKLKDFLKMRHFFDTVIFKNRKKYRYYRSLMKEDSVFFLNIACILYSTLDDENTSRIAALRSISLIQRVKCNVIDLCDALTNAIQLQLDRGTPDSTADLEKIAHISLQNLGRTIQANELFAVGKFFMAVFRCRLARGELTAAIRSGFRALVISRFLHAYKISTDIIPDLFYLLLSRRRISEAVDVLKLLLQLGESQTTLECETWYYALNIDMILDAGFQLESPYEISRFAEFSLQKGKAAGDSRRRLVVGLWTFWLRTDFERKAKIFETEALSWSARENDDDSFKTVMSSMRLAEGMLESLARKVDDLKKVVDLMELRSLADRELTRLEKDTKVLRAIYPRWILLRAYSLSLSGRLAVANNLFHQALEESLKINNRLEEALALAASSSSRFWCQNAKTGHFLPWQEGAEHARASWHQILYKITANRN